MSEGSLKELYDACDGKFDIPLADTTRFSIGFVLGEAQRYALEVNNLLYVYEQDKKYRLTTHFPDGWKTTGVARVYPGGRIELLQPLNKR